MWPPDYKLLIFVFLLLCLQLDSSSFFHDLAPGVENDGTGLIVALAAAKALGAVKRNVGYFRFADLLARNGKFFTVSTQKCGPFRKMSIAEIKKAVRVY